MTLPAAAAAAIPIRCQPRRAERLGPAPSGQGNGGLLRATLDSHKVSDSSRSLAKSMRNFTNTRSLPSSGAIPSAGVQLSAHDFSYVAQLIFCRPYPTNA